MKKTVIRLVVVGWVLILAGVIVNLVDDSPAGPAVSTGAEVRKYQALGPTSYPADFAFAAYLADFLRERNIQYSAFSVEILDASSSSYVLAQFQNRDVPPADRLATSFWVKVPRAAIEACDNTGASLVADYTGYGYASLSETEALEKAAKAVEESGVESGPKITATLWNRYWVVRYSPPFEAIASKAKQDPYYCPDSVRVIMPERGEGAAVCPAPESVIPMAVPENPAAQSE